MDKQVFKKRQKQFGAVFVISALFIFSSFLSIRYESYFKEIVSHKNAEAAFIYMAITALDIVVAPIVSTLPLLPIASKIWGPFMAAVFTIFAWFIGAWIAFSLARFFGHEIICKFLRIKNEEKWRNRLPRENLFWLVVFARVFLPIDVLSYVIGLFTDMRLSAYLSATLLGITPFAFIFAYGAQLPVDIQATSLLVFVVLVISNYKLIKKGAKKIFKNWFV